MVILTHLFNFIGLVTVVSAGPALVWLAHVIIGGAI